MNTADQIRARHNMIRSMTGKRPPMAKRLPRQLSPTMIRASYVDALWKMLAKAKTLVDHKLLPVVRRLPVVEDGASRLEERRDSDSSDLQDAIEDAASDFVDEFDNARLAELAGPFGDRTATFELQELGKQYKAALGVDLNLAEPTLAGELEDWTRANVALIKTVPQRYFADIESKTLEAFRNGDRPEQIERMLQERFGVAQSNAARIGRDQVGKLYGQLAERRQTDLGVRTYFWRTMEDDRVRKEHEELDGQEFEWDDPPEEGHPGEPIECRCFAEPNFETMQDDLGGADDDDQGQDEGGDDDDA
jgi:SPP1 gp7 family putative phage head morphogenesis protein